MSLFLTIGFYAGLCAGLLHAGHIVLKALREPGSADTGAVLYRALWAVLLWALLGAYLLFFWLLGLVLKPLIERRRASRAPS